MSIKKQYLKKNGICKVTFTVPQTESNGVQKAHVVGEFNDWSQSATPMKRLKKGAFKVTVELQKGHEYQFRYLFDEQRWENDAQADKSADTPYRDARNSVIVV